MEGGINWLISTYDPAAAKNLSTRREQQDEQQYATRFSTKKEVSIGLLLVSLNFACNVAAQASQSIRRDPPALYVRIFSRPTTE